MIIQLRTFVFVAATTIAACSSSPDAGSDGGADQEPAAPHALGVISMGEAHAASGGTATGSLAAHFVPDAALTGPRCTRQVAGCELLETPDCGGTCSADELCSFGDDCQAGCQRICDASCGASEECYFPTPDSPACRPRQTFDAGTLSFSGTTTPVTLFPPYSFGGVDQGALFAPGATLGITASGATGAGFAAFDASFTATTLLRTSPPLHELGIDQVFGTGPIPVGWVAGSDLVEITASVVGAGGTRATLTCRAEDAAGSFDVPREAIDAALDGDVLDRVTLAVTRRRTETVRGLSAMGSVYDVPAQPEGWLELTTHSTEIALLEGCDGGEQVCGGQCVDTDDDPRNCGACGNSCGADSCQQGTCSGTASCNTCVDDASTTGVCRQAHQACSESPACAALRTCFADCNTQTCIDQCWTDHPDGQQPYDTWASCICNTGCPIECADACG